MTNETRRPDFRPSIDTQMIIDRLRKTNVGETVGYEELTDLIGRDVRNGGNGCLQSARRHLEREHRMVFGTIRTIGVKRLSDEEIVDSGVGIMRSIRRKSRRAALRLTVVDYERLPGEAKINHQTYLSLYGALETVSKPTAVRRVHERVAKTQAALPLAKVLEAFGE